MEAYESAPGTLDDEEVQNLTEAQDKSGSNALAQSQEEPGDAGALERGISSNGWMMEAE